MKATTKEVVKLIETAFLEVSAMERLAQCHRQTKDLILLILVDYC